MREAGLVRTVRLKEGHPQRIAIGYDDLGRLEGAIERVEMEWFSMVEI